MNGIDPSAPDPLLARLDYVRARIEGSIETLRLSASRENSLWLQVLIGIVSSLGAELVTGAIDIAFDQTESSSAWVRPLERGELPVLDNFFDR